MRLGYFTMPVHPMGRDWSQTLREDREAIMLADKLGFHDAFMGEHLTDACENITNSMLFLATLIHDTKTIKLATGTTNLAQMHPVVIAVNAAMFDHLSQGRFIMGISPGALTSDCEAIGILDLDRNKIFAEAIDVILAIWERDPPYDIDFPDNRFKVGLCPHRRARARRRHPGKAVPEAAAGNRRHRGGAVLAGRGADGQARLPSAVGELPALPAPEIALDELCQGQGRSRAEGRTSPTGAWRARSSSPTTKRLRARYGREDAKSPYRHYFGNMRAKMMRGNRLYVFKSRKEQPDDEITLDYVMQNCVFAGTVNKVVDAILAMREETGDFGELVYAGMDWLDPALARRSMQLMAEEVMPRVNAAIGKEAKTAAE